MVDERVPMTREGYEKLKADLNRMQNIEMIEVAKRIAAARELGDLSENAEYHAAREDQGHLTARIEALKSKLGCAYIVDRSSLPSDTVVFGARVRIKNPATWKSTNSSVPGRKTTTTTRSSPPARAVRGSSARSGGTLPRSRFRAARCAIRSWKSVSLSEYPVIFRTDEGRTAIFFNSPRHS